jgi:hypothetical protein
MGKEKGEFMSVEYLVGVGTTVLHCVVTALNGKGCGRRGASVHHNSWVFL